MGTGNRVEMLIAICAVLTSAIAVFIAWDQGRVMRAQQHGMVYPMLQLDGFVSRQSASVSMGLRVENSGVGPALVESVSASVDGKPLEQLDSYRSTLPPGFELSWTGLAGRAVAPGKSLDALRFEWAANQISDAQVNAALQDWSGIDFQICYCSVFRRCWTTGLMQSRSTPVETCPSSDLDLFEEFGMSGSLPRPAPPVEDAP